MALPEIENSLTELERLLHRETLLDLERDLAELDARLVGDPFGEALGNLRINLREVRRELELLGRIETQRTRLAENFAALSKSIQAAETPLEREQMLLDFLALFTDPDRLEGDRKAFARHMDLDAVRERFLRHDFAAQVREEILVRLVAAQTAKILSLLLNEVGAPFEQAAGTIRKLGIEGRLVEQLRRTTRWQNQVAAIQALRQVVSVLPAAHRAGLLGLDTVTSVSRCCFNQNESTWVQRAAIDLLREIDPREVWNVYRQRLTHFEDAPDGDIFVRAHLVRVLAQEDDVESAYRIFRRVLRRPDPSELVRMEAVAALGRLDLDRAGRLLRRLITGKDPDPSPRVRARGLMELRRFAEGSEEDAEAVARVIARAIRKDTSFLVRRVALDEAAALAAERQRRLSKLKLDRVDGVLIRAIDRLIRSKTDMAIKRLAAEAREEIIVRNLPAFGWVASKIVERLRAVPPGGQLEMAAADVIVDEEALGRVLAFYTREDFDVTIQKGARKWVFTRGDRFRWRLWRVLHELRHPSPDKRQGFRHTIGRDYQGSIRCHSGLLAELTETKVPGERVYIEHERSWRRHIPLLDDYLSLFRRELVNTPVKIYSSLGVTTIRNTNSRVLGWWKWLKLSFCYARVAAHRNANPGNKEYQDAGRYVEILNEEYGLETEFKPWSYDKRGQEIPLPDLSLRDLFRRGVPPLLPSREQAEDERPAVEPVFGTMLPREKEREKVVVRDELERRQRRPKRQRARAAADATPIDGIEPDEPDGPDVDTSDDSRIGRRRGRRRERPLDETDDDLAGTAGLLGGSGAHVPTFDDDTDGAAAADSHALAGTGAEGDTAAGAAPALERSDPDRARPGGRRLDETAADLADSAGLAGPPAGRAARTGSPLDETGSDPGTGGHAAPPLDETAPAELSDSHAALPDDDVTRVLEDTAGEKELDDTDRELDDDTDRDPRSDTGSDPNDALESRRKRPSAILEDSGGDTDSAALADTARERDGSTGDRETVDEPAPSTAGLAPGGRRRLRGRAPATEADTAGLAGDDGPRKGRRRRPGSLLETGTGSGPRRAGAREALSDSSAGLAPTAGRKSASDILAGDSSDRGRPRPLSDTADESGAAIILGDDDTHDGLDESAGLGDRTLGLLDDQTMDQALDETAAEEVVETRPPPPRRAIDDEDEERDEDDSEAVSLEETREGTAGVRSESGRFREHMSTRKEGEGALDVDDFEDEIMDEDLDDEEDDEDDDDDDEMDSGGILAETLEGPASGPARSRRDREHMTTRKGEEPSRDLLEISGAVPEDVTDPRVIAGLRDASAGLGDAGAVLDETLAADDDGADDEDEADDLGETTEAPR